MMRVERLVGVILVLVASTAAAEPPACGALSGRQLRAARAILSSEHLYDCCDGTIASCLEATPTCRLAVRLADDVCRRVAEGQDEARIRRALSRRARSMIGGGSEPIIDLSGAPALGSEQAPVELVVYACGRCPYCSKLLPLLFEEIDSGRLAGQVRLHFRTFPVRGHEGSTEAGLALVSAQLEGHFWPYLLREYAGFDEFTAELLPEWAVEVGLERQAFMARMEDPATRELLVASKKEGLANGVGETPTFFLNRRLWVGDLELEVLVDAFAEEAERVQGDLWVSE
jgi:hypothetical protein